MEDRLRRPTDTVGSVETSEILGRTRAIALALPDATECLSHGSLSWFIGQAPMFASFTDHHHGVDWVAIWAAAPPGAQESLVERDPDVYFVPAYVGTRGWVGMRLDAETDWDAVEDLLDDAHACVSR